MSRSCIGWGAWCLVALMTAPALAADTAPPPTPPFEAQVSKEEANVRADSNVGNDVLVVLPRGSRVSVIEEHAGWYRIRLPRSARCYIAAPYVDGQGVVTAEGVNVRSGAERQFAILGQVRRGDQVRVLERLKGWVRVEPPVNCSGWIRADLVTPVTTAAAPAPMTAPAQDAVSSGLTATTVAAMTAASAATTNLPPTATGVLESTRGFRQPSQHRLTHAGRTLFYLRSNDLDLSRYKHQRVAVWGTMDTDIRAPHPLVIVQRVERAD